jgi:hypothetical protein
MEVPVALSEAAGARTEPRVRGHVVGDRTQSDERKNCVVDAGAVPPPRSA